MAKINCEISNDLYQHCRNCHKIANLCGLKISFCGLVEKALSEFTEFHTLKIAVEQKNPLLTDMAKELHRIRRKNGIKAIDTE